jgi:hypothetical protein
VDGHSGHAFFSAQTSAGRLMILQKGAAAIVKEAIEIAGRSNPDAVFGELFTRRDWTATWLPANLLIFVPT